jgi:hypothetical protein
MRRLLMCSLLVLVCAGAGAQTAPAFEQLYSPNAYYAPTLRGSDGNLYGIDTSGNFFSLTPSGTYKTVEVGLGGQLCLEQPNGTFLAIVYVNSADEYASVTFEGGVTKIAATAGGGCPVMANDGNYYGVDSSGGGAYGYGDLFQLTSAGKMAVLYSFTNKADGGFPQNLIQGSDGNLYGTDNVGFFRYSVSAGMLVYANEMAASGNQYTQPLIEAEDGNFYGLSSGGLVQITPTGSVDSLVPQLNLGYGDSDFSQEFLGGDGNLYLNTSLNVPSGCGGPSPYVGVFPVTLSGTVNQVYFNLLNFPDISAMYPGDYTSGSSVATMLLGGDGNFYGGEQAQSVAWDNFCDVEGGAAPNYLFSEVSTTPPTPPIAMTLSADHILPGKTATLTWKVNNAYSDTMKQCYGYGGLSGKLALSGSVTSPALGAGSYSSGIVCGGTEANNVTLTVGDTQLALTSNRTEIVAGQTVTLTATVANDANPSPTGTVQFLYGTTVLGTGKVNSAGVATFTASTTGIAPGTYAITAKYLGDGNYAAATSGAVSIKVVPKGTTTTVLSPATQKVIIGQNVPITATITTNSVLENPVGTVSLLVGTTVVATADVVYGSPSTASFSANSAGLAPGTYTVTAKYSGNIYNLPSTSGPVTVKLIKQDTLAVTASPNPVPANTAFQLSGTAAGGVTPTGTVLFYAGALGLGSATLNSSGVADITVSAGTLPAGSYQITGHYAGDANNAAITSPAITLTVQ